MTILPHFTYQGNLPQPRFSHTAVPLCVDLDGTFLHGAMHWALLRFFWRTRKTYVFQALCVLMMRGSLPFKRFLAWSFRKERGGLSDLGLVVRPQLLEALHGVAAEGRLIVLATGAPCLLALYMKRAYPFFNKVIASTAKNNCVKHEKVLAIKKCLPRQRFDYIGNSFQDKAVWQCCRVPYAVLESRRLKRVLCNRLPFFYLYSGDRPL